MNQRSNTENTIPGAPLLSVKNLVTAFGSGPGQVRAVDQVSLGLEKGRTLGLVGESGCGKTMTALSVMGLVPRPGRVVSGSIRFEGLELTGLDERRMRTIRGNEISMIFQEPMTSLNPVLTAGYQIAEVFRLHQGLNKRQALEAAVGMLGRVGIPAPGRRAREYPHQMSGGMRQRVMIAMALACRPRLMIADEPTTALDVTIQAQILGLMEELRREYGMGLLIITHNLGVVAETADEAMVMYAGQVVEHARVDDLFASPAHPYTQGLLASLPSWEGEGAGGGRLAAIGGMVPSLGALPAGCRFQPRCPRAFKPCTQAEPPLTQLKGGRQVRCHLYGS